MKNGLLGINKKRWMVYLLLFLICLLFIQAKPIQAKEKYDKKQTITMAEKSKKIVEWVNKTIEELKNILDIYETHKSADVRMAFDKIKKLEKEYEAAKGDKKERRKIAKQIQKAKNAHKVKEAALKAYRDANKPFKKWMLDQLATIKTLTDDIMAVSEMAQISGHDHPTNGESSNPKSKKLAKELNKKLNDAYTALGVDIAYNSGKLAYEISMFGKGAAIKYVRKGSVKVIHKVVGKKIINKIEKYLRKNKFWTMWIKTFTSITASEVSSYNIRIKCEAVKDCDKQIHDMEIEPTPTPTPTPIPYGKVSASLLDTAIVKTDGTLWMRGSRLTDYLLRDRTDTYLDWVTPVQVMSGVEKVSCGESHTAIVKTDGTLWMWGENDYGQLGDGTTTDRLTPVQVMSGVKEVSCGESHTAIVKTDGTLWMCGRNDSGQLGDGTTTDRLTPVHVMSGVEKVSCGASHTAIVTTDGTLGTWGDNDYGQLGDGTRIDRLIPVPVMSGVKEVSCGQVQTAILETDGTLLICMDGAETPQQIMNGVKHVSCGLWHFVVAIIKTDGTLWMLGDNDYGQLGDGTTTNRLKPVQTMSGVQEVGIGNLHTVILKTNGTVWMCGRETFPGLGMAPNSDLKQRYLTPVQIM